MGRLLLVLAVNLSRKEFVWPMHGYQMGTRNLSISQRDTQGLGGSRVWPRYLLSAGMKMHLAFGQNAKTSNALMAGLTVVVAG
jgi:hypothetical protein